MYMEAIFYFRMEFPEFDMICPVLRCPASSFYQKFDQLKQHWYNINVPEIMMHQCTGAANATRILWREGMPNVMLRLTGLLQGCLSP